MSGKVAARDKTAGNQRCLLSAATLAHEPSKPCGKLQSVVLDERSVQGAFHVPDSWIPKHHLGSGGSGSVASFIINGRMTAVKKIEDVFQTPDSALCVLREVMILAHFQHPNILGIFDLFVEGPNFKDVYFCLEMMAGDLSSLIYGREPATEAQTQAVTYQMIRGLLALHSARVVHRDLKPGNVLLTPNGHVKIADFGLARAIYSHDLGEDEELTEYVVTRWYRAPEIMLTSGRYAFSIDIWSLGCIVGELQLGTPLFKGRDVMDQMKHIFQVVGRPTVEDLDWLQRDSASWRLVARCSETAPRGRGALEQMLSGVSTQGGNLVDMFLQIHPSHRMPLWRALKHPFLAPYYSVHDLAVASARATPPIDWSFNEELSGERYSECRMREAFAQARRAARRDPVARSLSPATPSTVASEGSCTGSPQKRRTRSCGKMLWPEDALESQGKQD